MINLVLPTQYLRNPGWGLGEPHRRLMVAVLQTVVDDCRGSSYRRSRGWEMPIGHRDLREAIAYMSSTDRGWPFSFENLCDALGLDAGRLRRELDQRRET